MGICAADVETLAEDQLKLARYVLAGFRDSRSQIRTGVCRISGTRIVKIAKRNINHVGEIDGFVAFDLQAHVFRFERQEPTYTGQPRGGKYIKRDDMVITRRLESHQTSILKATSVPDVALSLFDVRTAGLATDVEFEMNVSLDKLLNEFLPESRLLEVAKESRYYRLGWKGAPGTNRTAWFDEDRGYCPVRMEVRFEATAGSRPLSVSELTVTKKDGMWVPETLSMRETPRPTDERHVSYVFDWRSVNHEIGDELFTVDALNNPNEKVKVTDYRLEEPIIISDPYSETAVVSPSRWVLGRVLLAAFGTIGLIGGILGLRILAKRRTAR